MTTEAVLSPLIVEEMAIVLQKLSPDLRQQVFDFAEFLVQRQVKTQVEKPKRVPGISRGAVLWMSDDFDEPLPDEFWESDTDPLMMTDEQIKVLNQESKV